MKLLCLPYAGASAGIYMRWRKRLAPDAECLPLELAGRGVRTGEPFYADMREAAEDLYERLRPQLDGTPYALFGHSMGGMIGYELARLIRDRHAPPPTALVMSGRPSPETPRKEAPIHLLSDAEFADRIREMGATSSELFANKQLWNVFMPILRADFRLVETYVYEEREPLPWPLTAIAGQEEAWTEAELDGWRHHTTGGCRIVRMPGGHFYWQDDPDPLLGYLRQALTAGTIPALQLEG